MLHAPTFLIGGLAGGAVFTLMMYLNFASVVKISTENLTAMMAFSPATAWLFQAVGDVLGLIKAPTPEPAIIAAIVACIAAVLLIFWASVQARQQHGAAAGGCRLAHGESAIHHTLNQRLHSTVQRNVASWPAAPVRGLR